MGDAAASGVKAGVASPNATSSNATTREFPGRGQTIVPGRSGRSVESGSAPASMIGGVGPQATSTSFEETDIQTVSLWFRITVPPSIFFSPWSNPGSFPSSSS